MTKMGFLRAPLLGTLALSALLSTPAAAQNGASFNDAAASRIRYQLATTPPRMACADVRSLETPTTTIISTETIAATADAPEHCRVTGVIAPEVRFEVNLPVAWNRRFYMHGNGGFAGETPETGARPRYRAQALKHGFTTASTNTGHDASAEPLGTFAANYQKRVDYAFRAVHLTNNEAKRIAAAYYRRPVRFAYWDGCSTGGRQGLMAAQRYPQDFDGVLAGAPVLNLTSTVTQSLWNGLTLTDNPIPIDKMKLVADAVYARCDALDGVKDGLIDDPRKCDFDPARDVRQCANGEESAQCLTSAETEALKRIYAGVQVNGRPYHFGQPVGAEIAGRPAVGPPTPESGWAFWLIAPRGQMSRQHQYGDSFVRYFAFVRADANYDPRSFNFERDQPRLADTRALVDATNPDLSAFRARGGKLLMYFGWADTALPPGMAIDYYEKALARNGQRTPDFFRLFMVPGMFHCRGGVGTDSFDAMTALINWVEAGRAPETLAAAQVEQGRVVRTRPLCPYPQVARYSGSGSIDEAANFACRPPQ
jgi:hypothetical protein